MANHTQQNDALEKVILVDINNRAIGLMDKLAAHQQGKLHRAFSVFVFNQANELLLQKRAATKYHAANQWANSCCGHPRDGESNFTAATRRFREEMGCAVNLTLGPEFIYKVPMSNGLIEHEFVQFLTATLIAAPNPNPFEVADYFWICKDDLFENPYQFNFAPWFKVYLNEYKGVIEGMFSNHTQAHYE